MGQYWATRLLETWQFFLYSFQLSRSLPHILSIQHQLGFLEHKGQYSIEVCLDFQSNFFQDHKVTDFKS